MLRAPARLLTPRFAVFHLGEKSLHSASFTSVKDSGVTLMRLWKRTIRVPTCSSGPRLRCISAASKAAVSANCLVRIDRIWKDRRKQSFRLRSWMVRFRRRQPMALTISAETIHSRQPIAEKICSWRAFQRAFRRPALLRNSAILPWRTPNPSYASAGARSVFSPVAPLA